MAAQARDQTSNLVQRLVFPTAEKAFDSGRYIRFSSCRRSEAVK